MARELPEEILIDIFSWLPAKSIGKCRCLGKRWRTLLSTTQFIKSHLARQTSRENLMLIANDLSIYSIANMNDLSASRELNLAHNWIQVAGSCDGLVLLQKEDGEQILLNPITLQQVRIQGAPEDLRPEDCFSADGFGYDCLTDDYKIVKISTYDTGYYGPGGSVHTFVHVYSVRSGLWKRVENSPYDHLVPDFVSGSFSNGAIHWLACPRGSRSTYPSIIAAFRLEDEVFDGIPCPSDVAIPIRLVVLGGGLCLVGTRNDWLTDVWVMREYGVAGSWTKYTFGLDYGEWGMIEPLCCIGDEEVVFLNEDEVLMVHKLKEGTGRVLPDDGYPNRFIDGTTFVESLVSPRTAVG